MGVPIIYQGSQYYPGIPPSKQYPAFSAAEVGNVNASTVAVTFSVDVSASNYTTGVTIKVNGSTATISSATRQANHAIVYYVLSAAVVNGDTVTWEYSGGSIVNEATGAVLQTTSAQSVTNNVAPAGDPIGDALRALYTFYLTLDEADTGVRHDSVGDNDLTPSGDINALAYTTGKVGNAARWGSPNYSLLFKKISDSGLDFVTGDCYWSFWFRSLNGDNSQQVFSILGGLIIIDIGWVPLGETYIYSAEIAVTDKFVTGIIEIGANEWHFIEAYYNKSAGEIGIALDGSAFATTGSVGAIVIDNPDAIFNIGKNDNECDLDEFGFSNTIPSAELRAALYNSGVGRALFPAP